MFCCVPLGLLQNTENANSVIGLVDLLVAFTVTRSPMHLPVDLPVD